MNPLLCSFLRERLGRKVQLFWPDGNAATGLLEQFDDDCAIIRGDDGRHVCCLLAGLRVAMEVSDLAAVATSAPVTLAGNGALRRK